jgi:hypothetical protein
MGYDALGNFDGISDNPTPVAPKASPAVVTAGPPVQSQLKTPVEPPAKKELTEQQLISKAINGAGQKDPTLDTSYNITSFPVVGSNPLNKFVSYNCLITLACLSKEDQNKGVFDKSKIKNIIARTQGDWGSNNRVKTEFGEFDYFIDDLIIVNQPKISANTGETFATKITFKVTEPYSMGLFLNTMLVGAQASGYENHREASYLLMIEFAGYTDDNRPHAPDPSLTRFIPIRFIDVKFSVKSSGSTYECEVIPYNELGFRTPVSDIKTSVSLVGSSVFELLITLQNALNDFAFKQINSSEMDVPDQYNIQFPSDFYSLTDLGSASEIARSIVFRGTETGNMRFPNQDDMYDPAKGIYKNRSIGTVTDKTYNFNSGTKIQEIISEVIIRSEFIIKQLTNYNVNSNKKGMIKWFRIELHVLDGPYSKILNRQTRTFNYRVVPYEVHLSKLLPPKAIPEGYEEIKKTVNRLYDYIYTGKNTEIISFDIEYNMAFFSNVSADAGNNPGSNIRNQRVDAGVKDVVDVTNAAKKNSNGNVATASVGQTSSVASGKAGNDTDESAQVRNYRDLLTNRSDLVEIKMNILGDPYYLPSSGFGNQIKRPAGDNIMVDGSMNYQSGEVDIVVNFRTPTDFNHETGLYNFNTTARVDQFSGLFEIFEVESKINQNKFTQTITARQRRTQLRGSGENTVLLGTKK